MINIIFMNMRFFLFISIYLIGCRSSHYKGGAHYYSDIDIFNMRGVGPIDKPIEPCFQIDSVGSNMVKLTTWFPKIGTSSTNYIKKQAYWTTSYPVSEDTIDLIYYEYCGRGKMITLEYENDDSSKTKLKTINYYNDSLEKVYRFKNYYVMRPDPDINLDVISDSMLREKEIKKFRIIKGLLEIDNTSVDFSTNSIARDTTSYKIGDHSLFWWKEFGR